MKIVTKACSWLGFILLLLSLLSALFRISILESTFIVFYGLSLLGLIFGLISWILLRFHTMDSVTQRLGKIGFFGNFALVILFYPPIYEIWGNWIFSS